VAACELAPVQDRLVFELDVASITPSARNPRDNLGEIDEMAASIEAFDLLQPVVVRRIAEGSYELIARRLDARGRSERDTEVTCVREQSSAGIQGPNAQAHGARATGECQRGRASVGPSKR
jgi:hypothetical protein